MTTHTTPQTEIAELLPCPFCGGNAFINENGDRFFAACGSKAYCCALGENWERDDTPEHAFATEAEARSAWNTRTHTTDNSELIERLLTAAALADAEETRYGTMLREATAALEASAPHAWREGRDAAARLIQKRMDDRFAEHGTREWDTNACYYEGAEGEIYEALDEEADELITAIRALEPKQGD